MESQTLPSWRTMARWALTAFVIWLIGWMLWRTGAALAPFVLGLILAYLLLPLVSKLAVYMPRWAAITVIYVVGLLAFVSSIIFLIPPIISQIGEFAGRLPGFYEDTIAPEVQSNLTWYRSEVPTDIQAQIDTQVANAVEGLRANASQYAQRIGETAISAITSVFRTVIFLAGFLIIPFWLFYVLLDQQQGKEFVDRLIPERVRADFWTVVTIIDRVFSAYIRGQLTLGLIVGIMSYVGLTIVDIAFGSEVDIPYKELLSVIAAFTELIPVVGPILGAIPAIIVGLFVSPLVGAVIAGLYVLIQQIENNLLVPRIIGGVVELHAAVLMVLLVVSASVAGLTGVILSAPLAAIGRDIYRYLNGRLRDPDDPRRLPAGALPIRASEITDME